MYSHDATGLVLAAHAREGRSRPLVGGAAGYDDYCGCGANSAAYHFGVWQDHCTASAKAIDQELLDSGEVLRCAGDPCEVSQYTS